MKHIIIILLLFIYANGEAKNPNTDENFKEKSDYLSKLFQHENVFIGPQPEYLDFKAIQDAGFVKVINMRTPKEIEDLEFYEDYLLEKADIHYHSLPIGGKDHKYSPEKLKEFANSLKNTDGKVLLHCGSGLRASQLWAAYMVEYEGKTPDEALALVADMGWWPMPMELLLNKKLSVSFSE